MQRLYRRLSWLLLGNMRLLLALLLVLPTALVASSSWFASASAVVMAQDGDDDDDDAANTPFVAGEVVLKLFRAADLPAVAAQYGLAATPLDQFGRRPIYRLQIIDGVDPLAKARQLVADGAGRVEFAEPNYLQQIPENVSKRRWAGGDTNPVPYTGLWAVDTIGLIAAHTRTRGAGVTVAVLDTGVDGTHPALAGRLLPGYDFVDDDTLPAEVGSYATNLAYGHGTHVAGIIALVAPDANILPIRVLDADGAGNIWVLAEAMAYAVDPNGDGDTSDGANVINLSLGTYRDTRLLSTVIPAITCSGDDDDDDDDRARDDDEEAECAPPSNSGAGFRGAVVVAAVGNDHNGDPATAARVVYPAAEPGVIGVAATDERDLKAPFSNYNNSSGGPVDISAPGVAIVSSVPGGGYGSWEGTSMAAPFVSGAAALLWSIEPQARAQQIGEELLRRVVNIDPANPPYAGRLGTGRLDVASLGENVSTTNMPLTLR